MTCRRSCRLRAYRTTRSILWQCVWTLSRKLSLDLIVEIMLTISAVLGHPKSRLSGSCQNASGQTYTGNANHERTESHRSHSNAPCAQARVDTGVQTERKDLNADQRHPDTVYTPQSICEEKLETVWDRLIRNSSAERLQGTTYNLRIWFQRN